jgi:hypothetical protein
MTETGYSKGACQNCGGHLEFPTTGIGLTIDCPHCGGQTTLVSSPVDPVKPAGNSPAGSKRKLPVLLGSVVLILILAAAGGALYGFKKPGSNPPASTRVRPPTPTNSEIPKEPSRAPEANDPLQAGPVTLQKTDGSALVYAVGTVRNNSDHQRFGVKIELDLLDEQDNKIGTAGDYIAVLEPHKDWPFRALLTQPSAVRAKVAKIEEQK